MRLIHARERWTPPNWALMERHLFDILNHAAMEFVERYTRPDGTLIWNRDEWPGMDGSDDPYEGFMNLALFYALGGSGETLAAARRIWEGITFQWTEYGQIEREFDKYYDWMHHGEGYLYFYFFGLCDPLSLKDRQRAERFARFYTGDDPLAPNYDKKLKLIRSPLTGSAGPRFTVTEEDWCTHRGILDGYLAPFEDIPGVDIRSGKCPWSDDQVYREIIARMNERMNRGDVPLNLNATSLVTHAYMYTMDEKYRQWVLEYLDAWSERARLNGGIIPDNVGLNGIIGEYNDGKWWGGYYGWRWPHGFMTIIEPIVNACMNALLLTGEDERLRLAREQLDRNWECGREEDGFWKVPYRRFDDGWEDYRFPNPIYPIYLWTASMKDEDLARIERIYRQSRDHDWNQIIIPNVSGRDRETGRETKHYIGNTIPWFQYIRGQNPDYPERILKANLELVRRQLAKMRSEAGDPSRWPEDYNVDDFSSIHIWQEMCPVYFEGLLQLMWGAPMHISHGGLQFARVRYYDADRRRPGLPEDVAALVEGLDADSVTLQLVNLNASDSRTVVIQGGSFGEHSFVSAEIMNQAGERTGEAEAEGKWLGVRLDPGAGIKLKLHMRRYANRPSYETPWSAEKPAVRPIRGRNV